MEFVGLVDWSDITIYTAEKGKALNTKLARYRATAEKLVKTAGHHIGDAMAGGGLEIRGVDNTLVDDLLGNGILQEGDDEEED